MFVLEALTLTFLTTPLVTILYPPERRMRESGHTHRHQGEENTSINDGAFPQKDTPWRYRFTAVLDKLEHVPGAMALTQLILPTSSGPSPVTSIVSTTDVSDLKMPTMVVDAVRLIELSDRTSAVMKSSAADTLIHTDPLLGIFRMFGELNDLPFSTSLSVVPFDDLAYSVADHATQHASQLILLPWLLPMSHPSAVELDAGNETPKAFKLEQNPFEALFGSAAKADQSSSANHCQFVRNVLAQCKSDVALFIDTGERACGSQHIFFPFFGGPDDRLALEFLVQVCLTSRVTATVARYAKRDVQVALPELPQGVHLNKRAPTSSSTIASPSPLIHTDHTSTAAIPVRTPISSSLAAAS